MKNDLKIYFPDDKNVFNFIKKFDDKYNKKLSNHINFSRVVSLSDFHRVINHIKLHHFLKVAVVSGSTHEPELELINYEHLDILQFESSSNSFNLDDDWETINNFNKTNINIYEKNKYDFVLCNQVLEHIFSPKQGMKNIYHIMKKGGYAWVSVPTINRIHGEPYFYSAGYHPRYLDRLCKEQGFEVIHIGAWGSRKYLAYAVQGKWSTNNALKKGFRSKYDIAHPYLALKDGRKNDVNGRFITDTWALIRKIND